MTINILSVDPAGGSPRAVATAINQLIKQVLALSSATSGGDVVGPASATNNHVVFFDGATGKLIKDSGLNLSGANTGDQTITLTGDVTGSGTGSFAATIGNTKVTLAKIANASANSKLLGSGASGSGSSYAELSLGTGLSMSGTTLNASLTSDFTRLAVSTPSGTGTVSFTSISGSYTHLKIVGAGRSSTSGAGSTVVKMQFNGDTGANYARQAIFANGNGSAGKDLVTGQNQISPAEVPTDGSASDYPGSFVIDIPLYSGTTFKKTAQSHYMNINNTTTGSLLDITTTGTWDSTAAITRVDLILTSGNWKSGSTISLYGLT